MFETYYNNLMAMKKMDNIKEGIAWGFFANYESTINSLMKWNKMVLARKVADRMVRLETRGY